jgi:hypothetical protein
MCTKLTRAWSCWPAADSLVSTPTVRDQFLARSTPAAARTAARVCQSLAKLNRPFTTWLHQRGQRGVHSKTAATPAQRCRADGRTRAAGARGPVGRSTVIGHRI